MVFNIDGWVPSELEQSLMDGSFDEEVKSGADTPDSFRNHSYNHTR